MQAFANGQNVRIERSTFNMVEHRGPSVAFEKLRDNIADGAMHDSGERFDPPKCYPGTREAVLKQLLVWVIEHDREVFMHWLHGPAGAGKSAILQEIAERCAQMKLLIASFFFSRTAALRNNEKRLVATLAYQLAQSVPETRPYIEKAIEHDPAIFSKRLQSQFQALIVKPLNQASSTAGEEWACWPHLILIDGLDECSIDAVQQNILTCLATSAGRCGFPITVLVSSRPETHIAMTFGQHPFKYILRTALDENYRPEEDIRRFLAGTFRGIKENHPFRSYLSHDWPSPAFVEALVHKSSGQFIYAATVARYVSHPDSHPAQYLDVVLGLSPSNCCEPPFAELDALYYHILSSLPHESTSLRILALAVLPSQGWNQTPQQFDSFLGLRSGVSQQILHKLASIIKLDDDSTIRLLHASLADFLFDRCRSQKFYVDVPLQAAYFARLCFQNSAGATSEILFERIVLYRAFSYCSLAALTEELLEDLADFNFPTVARGTDEQSEVIDSPTIRTSRRLLLSVVDGYLSCLQIIKDRFPDLSVAVYTRCQQNVYWVIGSQVELYRSSVMLATLLSLYAVIPANSLLGSRDIFDVLLAPAQSPELQSAILIDDSSLRLRDWFEGQFMYNETIYADEHRYASSIRKLLEPEDFTKAAKVMVSHIISYQGSTLSITEGDHNHRRSAYFLALEYLPRLVRKASTDHELLNLLRLNPIQRERNEIYHMTFKAQTERAIAGYLVRSGSKLDTLRAFWRIISLQRRMWEYFGY